MPEEATIDLEKITKEMWLSLAPKFLEPLSADSHALLEKYQITPLTEEFEPNKQATVLVYKLNDKHQELAKLEANIQLHVERFNAL